MDDTKKTLLSIDLDTDALTKNAKTAKDAIAELTNQLNALKAAGQANTPVFAALSGQLKNTTADYKNATKAIQNYTKAFGDKTKVEKDNTTANQNSNAALPQQKSSDSQNIDAGTDTQRLDLIKETDLKIVNQQLITNQQLIDAKKDYANASLTLEAQRIEEEKKMLDEWRKKNPELAKKGDDAVAYQKALKDASDKHKKDKQTAEDTARQKLAEAHTKKSFDDEMKLLDAKYKGYETTYDKLGNLFSKNTEAARAALFLKKAMTVAEVAISTEQSIAASILATKHAVANDQTLGPILGPVMAGIDIAAGIADVATTTTLGVKQIAHINSIDLTPPDGKARGGIFESDGLGAYLTGPGNGTSDSINARLSNGESVINARSTQMFAPLLSAINQAGGGVAFHTNSTGAYATGGLFNGSNTLNDSSTDLATTRATNDMMRTIAANMPRQVLVVEDVQASLQNKVMLQNMSNF